MSTIKQIAQHAGISTCAVSRYLNGKLTLSYETEQRVQYAIKDLSYVPSRAARSLKTSKTQTVAILLPQISSLYYTEITAGISEVLAKEDYSIFLCELPKKEQSQEQFFKNIYAQRADGIIVISYDLQDTPLLCINHFLRANIPLVWINRGGTALDFSLVHPNYAKCGELAAQRLLADGYQHFGFVTAVGCYDSPKDHLNHFIKTIQQNSRCDITENHQYYKQIESPALVDTLQKEIENGKLDALFVTEEKTAAYLIKMLNLRGISIPKQFGILGYGNSFLGTITTPTMTTLDLHNSLLGEKGAQQLLSQMQNKKQVQTDVVEPTLIVRESC